MSHAVKKSLCQVTENSSSMNIFGYYKKNAPFVSFKALFSVDIPLLKPYCSETSKLLHATRWHKLLHISFSNTSEKHHVIVTEVYDLSH
jgi:hypothetical protein